MIMKRFVSFISQYKCHKSINWREKERALKSTYKMNILYYTQKYSFMFCSGTYGQKWQYRSSIWLNKYNMKIQVFHNVTPSQQINCYQCLKNHGAYIFQQISYSVKRTDLVHCIHYFSIHALSMYEVFMAVKDSYVVIRFMNLFGLVFV